MKYLKGKVEGVGRPEAESLRGNAKGIEAKPSDKRATAMLT